jgi:hypothetical protein
MLRAAAAAADRYLSCPVCRTCNSEDVFCWYVRTQVNGRENHHKRKTKYKHSSSTCLASSLCLCVPDPPFLTSSAITTATGTTIGIRDTFLLCDCRRFAYSVDRHHNRVGLVKFFCLSRNTGDGSRFPLNHIPPGVIHRQFVTAPPKPFVQT